MLLEMRQKIGRRRSDYLRPVLVAALTALSTSLVQCAFDTASHAAREEYWRHYSSGVSARLQLMEHR